MGRLFGRLLGPIWGPSWPKFGPKRLWRHNILIFFFQKNERHSGETASCDPKAAPKAPQDRPKIAPRWPQVLKRYFFDARFRLRFWCVLGPILDPFWVPKSVILGVDFGSFFGRRSRTVLRAPQEAPRAPQELLKRPQERPKNAPRSPKSTLRGPKSILRGGKRRVKRENEIIF